MVAYKVSSIAEDTFYRRLGMRLENLRTQAEMSQLDLAMAMEVSQRNISAYETGDKVISVRTLLSYLYEVDAPESELSAIFDIFTEEKLNERG